MVCVDMFGAVVVMSGTVDDGTVVEGAVVDGAVVVTGFVVEGAVVVTLVGVTAVVLPAVVLWPGNVVLAPVGGSSSVSGLPVVLVSADSNVLSTSSFDVSADDASSFTGLRSHETKAMHRIAVASNAAMVCEIFIYSFSSFY